MFKLCDLTNFTQKITEIKQKPPKKTIFSAYF